MKAKIGAVGVFLSPVLFHDVLALTATPPLARGQWSFPTWQTPRTSSSSSHRRCSVWRNTNCAYQQSNKVNSFSLQDGRRSPFFSCTSTSRASATEASDIEENGEQASNENPQPAQLTIAAASLNLIKAIVGSGVLALPSGVAAMSDFPKALIPASVLLLVLGSLSAYTFGLYGRLCHAHQAKTLGKIWEKEFGTSPWLLSLGLFLFCGGAALTYNIVVGDTFSSLATSLGVTGWLASRHASILLISITTLLPLCSLSSLAALAPMSMLGVVGVLVTTLFMAWRCLSPSSPYRLIKSAGVAALATQRIPLAGPARAVAGSSVNFLNSLSPQFYPKFNTYSKIISPSALILAAMAATSFTGHFSAPDFYHSLRGTTNDNKFALRKYHRVTAISFASVAVINILILAFGFLTFGGNSAGIILNNYSTLDKGASICRFLMALSVIGGYPFLVSACKTALMEVMDHFSKKNKDVKDTSSRRRLETTVTRALVASFTSLALILPNAGFVISFNGALLGSVFCYVLPAILFLSHTAKSSNGGEAVERSGGLLRLERWISYSLVAFGSVAGLAGGAVSILNAYFPQVLR